jgi:hypothetical protein
MTGVTDPVGNLAQRQHLLKQLSLVVEFPLRNLSGDIEASKRPEHALFLLRQAIPCVLHLENTVSLKTITMLIIDGVSSAVEGILFADVVSEIERVDKYIATIELIVNTNILGSETSPSHNGGYPMTNGKRRLGPSLQRTGDPGIWWASSSFSLKCLSHV